MRITICDDEEKHLAQIAAYTSEYLKKQNLDITLKEFISPHELLNYEYINGGSTIYLLDIVMEGMSGLELAQRLRECTLFPICSNRWTKPPSLPNLINASPIACRCKSRKSS